MGRKVRSSSTRLRPVDALFSTTRQRVLDLLFCHPDRAYHATELIELARVGTGAVQRELARLVASGLVSTTKIGKRTIYRANREAAIFSELHDLLVKTTGLADPLRDALQRLEKRIRWAFVFGSIAKGTESAQSDVDVMVVGEDITMEELFGAFESGEKRLGRKIHPVVYSPDEFQQRIDEGHPFLTRVLEDERIDLIGGPTGTSTTR